MKINNVITWSPKKVENLEALDITVIGGTGGLGRAISQELAKAGANVTVVGQTFRDSKIKNIKFVKADLSSIEESRKVAKSLDVSQTDIILFTTGIFAARTRQETAEGLERDLAVSFLNRLVITEEVVPKLLPSKYFSASPRVFIMAYPGTDKLGVIDDLNCEKSYGSMKAHMNTVAGNEALVYEGAVRYRNAVFFGLNPGLVKTSIRNNFLGEGSLVSSVVEGLVGWFNQTPQQYASHIAPLLIADGLHQYNGSIFNNKGKGLRGSKGFTTDYANKYIKASEELLKSKNL